ncbi:DUF1232 domain-containing protein [Synechococcus sp. RedBA-s]|uniref:DUF1232 domain-containing protein n=1 Tax=Synechococcus sp. RedBA-s TaxID=2823741 RepID=UPI0020CBFF10|nr:DUF1232 domain-containing protein [Synechococcus sp. RedBA-s]MCP9801794.1 DUF1232 domain-containing protein [Synechococcus sp. RedBA-s]
MLNPLQPLLDRCSRGFTMPQKLGVTALGLLWVISPLDLDFLPLIGWIDDVMVLDLLRRVWMAPLLPRPNGHATAVIRPAVSGTSCGPRSMVRREHAGGAR